MHGRIGEQRRLKGAERREKERGEGWGRQQRGLREPEEPPPPPELKREWWMVRTGTREEESLERSGLFNVMNVFD